MSLTLSVTETAGLNCLSNRQADYSCTAICILYEKHRLVVGFVAMQIDAV